MAEYGMQLTRTDELAPLPRILLLLAEHSHPADAPKLYQRFLWELMRDRTVEEALDVARVAAMLESQPSGDTDLDALARQVDRCPVVIQPGAADALDSRLTVMNMTEQPIIVASREMITGVQDLATDHHVTAVIDDHRAAARATDDRQLIWQVPVHADDASDSWSALAEHDPSQSRTAWIEAHSNHRHLVAVDQLPNEHAVRIARLDALLIDVISGYAFEGQDSAPVSEDEIMWGLRQFHGMISTYTANPRVALSCRSVNDLSAHNGWERHGPAGSRALIAAASGDDPQLTAVLAAHDRLRIGHLAFTGDPDKNGDDLLSASLPFPNCYAILKPDVLDNTIFLSGIPHATASLPVPQQQYGFRNTLAVGWQVQDMMRSKALLALLPAVKDANRAYFQGRGQVVQLTSESDNHALKTFMTALLVRRQRGDDHTIVRSSLRQAAAHALFADAFAHPMDDTLGAVHLGPLTIDDVEQLVVPLNSPEEFEQFYMTGTVPSYMQPVVDHYRNLGINVRPRAPVTNGAVG